MSINFERISLGHFPTPIEYMENITKHLNGPKIYIKRDDCSGLATGGNKTRKLEYLMPDAIKNNASSIVTIGAIQSNHARQTAAACALLDLKCVIILEQRLQKAPAAYMNSGNVFLNKILGAEILICPKNKNVEEYAQEILKKKKENNERPYFIPVGGSNEIGELGYIECMREIINDKNYNDFSHVILASGSGGTHSGSIVGKNYYKSNIKILGISVKDKKITQEEKVFSLAKKACKFIKCKDPIRNEIIVFDDYVGKGYGIPTTGMRNAVKFLAAKEGILLDPVYSGKCFDGLLDLVQKKYFIDTDKILFVHTGGAVSLHAYEWAF